MADWPGYYAEALRMAAYSLRTHAGYLWHDDMLQAGRIALWLKRPSNRRHACVVARSAMIDELRRVTNERAQGCTIPGAVAWALLIAADTETPDSWLQMRQTLAALDAVAPGWPEALALAEDLRRAGARMGVSESRACQRRGDLARAALAATRL